MVQTRDGDTAVELILGSHPSVISPGFQEPMEWPLRVQGPSVAGTTGGRPGSSTGAASKAGSPLPPFSCTGDSDRGLLSLVLLLWKLIL